MRMKQNVGKTDKVIRLIIGVILLVFGLIAKSWLGLIGIIPIFTALVSWCPLYSPLKINTKKQ